LLIAFGFLYPHWACERATWDCPANGSGSVPYDFCLNAAALGVLVLVTAMIPLVFGILALSRKSIPP